MEAKVSKASINWFWALGMIVYSILSKVLVKSSRYCWWGFRCSSFTFHNLYAWAITKVKSLKTLASFTPNSQRASIPTIQALYSAILLVASKFNLTARGMWDPSGVINSTLSHFHIGSQLRRNTFSMPLAQYPKYPHPKSLLYHPLLPWGSRHKNLIRYSFRWFSLPHISNQILLVGSTISTVFHSKWAS